MPLATSSFLFLVVMPLLLVAMPGATTVVVFLAHHWGFELRCFFLLKVVTNPPLRFRIGMSRPGEAKVEDTMINIKIGSNQ